MGLSLQLLRIRLTSTLSPPLPPATPRLVFPIKRSMTSNAKLRKLISKPPGALAPKLLVKITHGLRLPVPPHSRLLPSPSLLLPAPSSETTSHEHDRQGHIFMNLSLRLSMKLRKFK